MKQERPMSKERVAWWRKFLIESIRKLARRKLRSKRPETKARLQAAICVLAAPLKELDSKLKRPEQKNSVDSWPTEFLFILRKNARGVD